MEKWYDACMQSCNIYMHDECLKEWNYFGVHCCNLFKDISNLQGYGTFFYSDTEYYEGEWAAHRRCGWGRMYYEDGSIYEGEWKDDKQSGRGMYRLGEWNTYDVLESFRFTELVRNTFLLCFGDFF